MVYQDFKYLLELGFKFSKNSGPRGEFGYTKKFSHNKNGVLWVTIDPIGKLVYLYKEWDCGGMLWDRKIPFTNDVSSMGKYEFINWLDKKLDKIC